MIGYLLAILIGLSLGLMGGGGSILTVPILVYALDMTPKLSIALSLAIVGVTSLVGSISHFKNGHVNFKIAIVFGPIAMLGTFVGARYLAPFFSGSAQLILFSLIMLLASFFMFRGKTETKNKVTDLKIPLILIEGLLVGLLTGLVGVGGGFMIVPALVLLAGIPMKEAIGTSLLIIAFKSFAGFAGYLDQIIIPWSFLIQFTAATIVGILLGSYAVRFVPAEKLKKAFAIFLVFMGLFILYKNHHIFL